MTNKIKEGEYIYHKINNIHDRKDKWLGLVRVYETFFLREISLWRKVMSQYCVLLWQSDTKKAFKSIHLVWSWLPKLNFFFEEKIWRMDRYKIMRNFRSKYKIIFLWNWQVLGNSCAITNPKKWRQNTPTRHYWS